jgi:hypothetical protein
VNVAEVAPFETVMLAGTVAAAVLSLDKVTVRWAEVPVAGAVSLTVPVEFVAPPGTLVGFRVTEATETGSTVRTAVAVPLNLALIVALAAVSTVCDVTVKVAVVAPEATVTLLGTVAAAVLLLDKLTVRALEDPAAGAFNVTVPVEFAEPPSTLVGFSVSDVTAGGGTTVRTAN